MEYHSSVLSFLLTSALMLWDLFNTGNFVEKYMPFVILTATTYFARQKPTDTEPKRSMRSATRGCFQVRVPARVTESERVAL
jgi:hypothetical protein